MCIRDRVNGEEKKREAFRTFAKNAIAVLKPLDSVEQDSYLERAHGGYTMQPTLCSRCKKNVAVVFISKIEGDKTINEGLCLKCAKDLGLPQVDDMMKRMGISDEDLDTLNSEMMQAMNGVDRKSTCLNSSHSAKSRMPSSA